MGIGVLGPFDGLQTNNVDTGGLRILKFKYGVTSAKFHAKKLVQKARSKASTEGKSLAGVFWDYLVRKTTGFVRRRLVLLNPSFDYMKWKNRSEEQAREELFFNRPPSSNEFLWNLIDMSKVESILEIGSNSGNRLYEVAKRFPEKRFVGVDINLSAVKIGEDWAKSNQIPNLEFFQADITSEKFYEHFENFKFDLVFSWASLIYIHPTKIRRLIQFLLEMANQQLLIIEQNDPSLVRFPKYLGVPVHREPTWLRNYGKIVDVTHTNKIVSYQVLSVPFDVWHPGGGWAQAVNVLFFSPPSSSDSNDFRIHG